MSYEISAGNSPTTSSLLVSNRYFRWRVKQSSILNHTFWKKKISGVVGEAHANSRQHQIPSSWIKSVSYKIMSTPSSHIIHGPQLLSSKLTDWYLQVRPFNYLECHCRDDDRLLPFLENSFGIPGKEQSSTFLLLRLEQETFIPQNL